MTRRATLLGVAALAVVLVASQLLLPTLAEHRVRGMLDDNGDVRSVEISAFPALKLLWGKADRVKVRIGAYRSETGRLAELIAKADAVGTLDARAARVRVGPLLLRDGRLEKRSGRLDGEATLLTDDLRKALPPGFEVEPVASSSNMLVLEGRVSFLGFSGSGRAVLEARDGHIVLSPDLPLASLVSLTVFSDRRLSVDRLGARAAPSGFRLFTGGRIVEGR